MTKLYSIKTSDKCYIIYADNMEEATKKFKNMLPIANFSDRVISEHIHGAYISIGGTDCYVCQSGMNCICGCSSNIECSSINPHSTYII
jgi:hypothetical protein